jgi:hypothetical protein
VGVSLGSGVSVASAAEKRILMALANETFLALARGHTATTVKGGGGVGEAVGLGDVLGLFDGEALVLGDVLGLSGGEAVAAGDGVDAEARDAAPAGIRA